DHYTLTNVYKAYKETSTNSTSQYYDVEKWCHVYFLSCSALRRAEVIRAELAEIVKCIELPISEPDFESKENTLSIKKALLSGYFIQPEGSLGKGTSVHTSMLEAE
ncbi:unnamed protein product, partial [Eretmochelys imbricata]